MEIPANSLSERPEASRAHGNSARAVTRPAGTNALRHLFGPVALAAALSAVVILAAWIQQGKPPAAADRVQALQIVPTPQATREVQELLDYQLKDYRAGLDRFTSNLQLQAVVIIVTILLIIRRSDSLNVLDNLIPLSWLHFFVPALLIYLWLGFGFTLGDLIWGRIRGLELITALHRPTMQYQKALFRDAGFIDGWFLTFVDKSGNGEYSGIKLSFATTAGFLVLVLGTLVA